MDKNRTTIIIVLLGLIAAFQGQTSIFLGGLGIYGYVRLRDHEDKVSRVVAWAGLIIGVNIMDSMGIKNYLGAVLSLPLFSYF